MKRRALFGAVPSKRCRTAQRSSVVGNKHDKPNGNLNSQKTQSSLDPEVIFRQALCFDYSGQLLSNATAPSLAAHAASGELAAVARTRPTETQTPGGIFLPPIADKTSTSCVTVQPGMLFRLPTVIPMIVIQSFATELYLKCILVLNGAKGPRGHELVRLYEQITADQQSRMEEYFTMQCEGDAAFLDMKRAEHTERFTLTDALRDMNRAFEVWRYAYESPGPQSGAWGHPWIAAGRLILELRPDWQLIAANFPTPPTFQHC